MLIKSEIIDMLCDSLAPVSLAHFVIEPVINMREHPSESSEIVSQSYFSEEVHVVEEILDWIKIETAVDNYQGWVKTDGICKKQEKIMFSTNTVKVNRCMAHVYSVPDIVYGPLLTVPFESLLEVESDDDGQSRWIKVILPDQRSAFIQRGDVTFDREILSLNQMVSTSLQFQGLPYTWGGRSSFGYDCSGFVQMLYRQMGVFLPRDSKDQVNWKGFETVSMDELSVGNLIFFGLEKNKIRHVGMYLGGDQFIHATVAENAPYIHISCLSDPEWNGSAKWPYRVAKALKKEVNS